MNKPAVKSADDLQEILAESGKRLNDLLRQVMPRVPGAIRSKLCEVLQKNVSGELWVDISKSTGISWAQIQNYKRWYKTFFDLWNSSREIGDLLKVEQRENAAHKRAVQGWAEPVFFKGEECGAVQRFSDRLLELLLKADNPKYRGEQFTVNVQTNMLMDQLKGSSVSSLIEGSVIDTVYNIPPVPPRRRVTPPPFPK